MEVTDGALPCKHFTSFVRSHIRIFADKNDTNLIKYLKYDTKPEYVIGCKIHFTIFVNLTNFSKLFKILIVNNNPNNNFLTISVLKSTNVID